MFYFTASQSKKIVLDLSNFDTSKVTNMSNMFYGTGVSNPNFELNISNFKTNRVTNMAYMFYNTGYLNPNFTLDVSGFDTTNVTNMSNMFYRTGYQSTTLNLDVGGFDTSKVTNMSYMFYGTGYASSEFKLNLSGFDTSNLKEASYMVYQTGTKTIPFELDLTISNPNMTGYNNMFTISSANSKITLNYTPETKDLTSRIIQASQGRKPVLGELTFKTGNEVSIGNEKFNVISQTEDTVTLITKLPIDQYQNQSETPYSVFFSNVLDWKIPTGTTDIDIYEHENIPVQLMSGYIEKLKTETGDSTLKGNLPTLKDFAALGCRINSDYTWNENPASRTCANSSYKNWIAGTHKYWLRSAVSGTEDEVWVVDTNGYIIKQKYGQEAYVRPVITMSKDILKELNK